MTDEQRSQTGWIGVQEWVVIFARALSLLPLSPSPVLSLRICMKVFALSRLCILCGEFSAVLFSSRRVLALIEEMVD